MNTKKFWKNMFKARTDVTTEKSEELINGVAEELKRKYNYEVTPQDRIDILKIILTNNLFPNTVKNITMLFIRFLDMGIRGYGPY